MKHAVFAISLVFVSILWARGYNDHRGHNLDSLERVVAPWTPDAVDKASEEELVALNRAYRELSQGYNTLNGEKSMFYARKALALSEPRGWNEASADACRYIGQHFWAREQYDSALVYYGKALENLERMAEGAPSPTNPEGYSQKEIDDTRSALYGAIGNLYNMMGDIPRAMEYYTQAGEIFERYGWNESNSILYYNIGETWVDEGDLKEAEKAYIKSMDYAQAAQDSLLVANAQKGLGRVYMERGNNRKAISYLRAANEYYAAHEKEELTWRKETFEYLSEALQNQQKKRMRLLGTLCGALTALAAVGLGLWWSRRSRRKASDSTVPAASAPDVPGPANTPGTSKREKEILDLLAKGYTTPQIAEALSLSPETVKWYRKKLLVKFDAANTAELVLAARKAGEI